MDLFFRQTNHTCHCKDSTFRLACSFVCGLIFGSFVFYSASDSILPLMRAADFYCMSIVSLLSVLLLPFLFSAFAVYIHQSWLLIPISFLKAFSFGFLYVGFSFSFGSAGWLIRLLLMFSDILTLPVLWWFWLSIAGGKCNSFSRFVATFLFTVIVGCFDFLVVSPCAAQLIS